MIASDAPRLCPSTITVSRSISGRASRASSAASKSRCRPGRLGLPRIAHSRDSRAAAHRTLGRQPGDARDVGADVLGVAVQEQDAAAPGRRAGRNQPCSLTPSPPRTRPPRTRGRSGRASVPARASAGRSSGTTAERQPSPPSTGKARIRSTEQRSRPFRLGAGAVILDQEVQLKGEVAAERVALTEPESKPGSTRSLMISCTPASSRSRQRSVAGQTRVSAGPSAAKQLSGQSVPAPSSASSIRLPSAPCPRSPAAPAPAQSAATSSPFSSSRSARKRSSPPPRPTRAA